MFTTPYFYFQLLYTLTLSLGLSSAQFLACSRFLSPFCRLSLTTRLSLSFSYSLFPSFYISICLFFYLSSSLSLTLSACSTLLSPNISLLSSASMTPPSPLRCRFSSRRRACRLPLPPLPRCRTDAGPAYACIWVELVSRDNLAST